MTKRSIFEYYVSSLRDKNISKSSFCIDFDDFVENLCMSDVITRKQKDTLKELDKNVLYRIVIKQAQGANYEN